MGLTLSTKKYTLEHSFLPINHKECCIPLYKYEFFIATSPCKFIFKETNATLPKWIYYEGYITELTKGYFSTQISNELLETKGTNFTNMSDLTDFIKNNNVTVSKCSSTKLDNKTYLSINNNYLNQMV